MSLFPGATEVVVIVDGLCVRCHDSDEQNTTSEPIVLIHGTGGTTGSHFWALYPMLATKRRVIGIDLMPPTGDEPAEISKFVAQVVGALDALGIDRPVHLAGYSLGAVVAAATAASWPDRFSTITLVAGWMRTDTHQRMRNSVWRILRQENSSALRDLSVYTAYSPAYLRSLADYQFEELLQKASERRPSDKEMELNARVDITGAVAAIRTPTLIIGCTQDNVVPIHHSRELFGAIEDSRFIELPSGHGVVQERPAHLFALIEDFCLAPGIHRPGTLLQPHNA